jgi:hypothetical protein
MIIAEELANYNYKASPIWMLVRQQFSSGVRQRELTSIACILCSLIETLPLLTRSEKRSYPLLIRWFERYWSEIEPFLPLIQLCDANKEVINFERERKETIVRHSK